MGWSAMDQDILTQPAQAERAIPIKAAFFFFPKTRVSFPALHPSYALHLVRRTAPIVLVVVLLGSLTQAASAQIERDTMFAREHTRQPLQKLTFHPSMTSAINLH